MSSLLLPVLVASLVGSLHCAGMCGPFVAVTVGADSRARAWVPTVAYNGGRLLTYTLLGAGAGALGGALDLAGRAAGLMVAWGGLALAVALGARLGRPPRALAGLTAWLGRRHAELARRPPVVRALGIGLLTTLLPCGWLHAFTLTAAATGSAARGGAVMAAFWLGTVPLLAGLGLGLARLAEPLRRRLPIVTAALVLALGLAALLGRLHVPVAGAEGGVPSCCHGAP